MLPQQPLAVVKHAGSDAIRSGVQQILGWGWPHSFDPQPAGSPGAQPHVQLPLQPPGHAASSLTGWTVTLTDLIVSASLAPGASSATRTRMRVQRSTARERRGETMWEHPGSSTAAVRARWGAHGLVDARFPPDVNGTLGRDRSGFGADTRDPARCYGTSIVDVPSLPIMKFAYDASIVVQLPSKGSGKLRRKVSVDPAKPPFAIGFVTITNRSESGS